MLKGISPTIAMLLLVVMVVGLSITLYFYSDKIVGRTVSKSVEFLDAACSPSSGQFFITIRNTALYEKLQTDEILVNLDGVPTSGRITWDVPNIEPNGGIGVGNMSGAAYGPHRIKIVSPVSQPQELALVC